MGKQKRHFWLGRPGLWTAMVLLGVFLWPKAARPELAAGARGMYSLAANAGMVGSRSFYGYPMIEPVGQSNQIGGNYLWGSGVFGEISFYRDEFYFDLEVGYLKDKHSYKLPGERTIKNNRTQIDQTAYITRESDIFLISPMIKAKSPGLRREYRFTSAVGFRYGYRTHIEETLHLFATQFSGTSITGEKRLPGKAGLKSGKHKDYMNRNLLHLVFGLGFELIPGGRNIVIHLESRFGFDFSSLLFESVYHKPTWREKLNIDLGEDAVHNPVFEIMAGLQLGVAYRLWFFKN